MKNHLTGLALVFVLCSQSATAQNPPELQQILNAFEKVTAEEVAKPLSQKIATLDQKYGEALDREIGEATKSGDLDTLLELKSEKTRLSEGKPFKLDQKFKSAAAQNLAKAYTSQIQKIRVENEQLKANYATQLIASLEKLQKDLTVAGKIDEAIAVKTFREGNGMRSVISGHESKVVGLPKPLPTEEEVIDKEMEEARKALESIFGVRRELGDMKSQTGSENSGTSSTPSKGRKRILNHVKAIPMFEGKAGRLRFNGQFPTGAPVFPAEAEKFTDIVEVHAFEKAWVAVRANGEAIVYSQVDGKDYQFRTIDNFVEIGRAHDCWTVNDDLEFRRQIKSVHDTVLEDFPDVIVGCHVGGLAAWNDGRVTAAGGAYRNSSLFAPPKEFFIGNAGVVSGSHWILALNPDGTVHGWDAQKGTPTEFKDVSGIVEMGVGRNHALLRTATGEVTGVFLDGRIAAPDPRWAVPVEGATGAARVRAGEHMSAIQRADGRWFVWGEHKQLCAEANELGPVMDLDLFANGKLGYVMWVETITP